MDDLIPILSKITRLAAAFKFLRFVLFWILMIFFMRLWEQCHFYKLLNAIAGKIYF